jgi:hypothetical protein
MGLSGWEEITIVQQAWRFGQGSGRIAWYGCFLVFASIALRGVAHGFSVSFFQVVIFSPSSLLLHSM